MKEHMCLFGRISRVFPVLLVVVMLICSAAFPTGVRADSTITVNSTADTSAIDGSCTLREAIANANADLDTSGGDCSAGSGADRITFAGSLGTATITLASTLPDIYNEKADGLTIDGDNRITLSGNDTVRVMKATTPLTLQNISITHGNAGTGVGGGVYIGYGSLVISNSTFSDNKARTGGGVGQNDGTVTITHSVFLNNSVTVAGGGVQVAYGTMTITSSFFLNNSSDIEGGGVDNSVGTLIIANSTFSNNSAISAGGGLENNSGTATILNSTFSGNSSNSGGAVSTYNGSASSPPTTTIRNSILANSTTAYDCYNHPTGTLNGSNNIIEAPSTCASLASLASDPKLGSLAGSPAYFPLNSGSPAIDAGDDAVCAAAPVNNTSQNGVLRPQGAHCDIGSFELDDTPPAVLSSNRADPDPANAPFVHFTVTFSEAVTGVNVADFSLTTTGSISAASVAGVAAGLSAYTVTVNTGTGVGTIRLDVMDDDSIVDAASNPLGGIGAGNGNFIVGQTYTFNEARVFTLYLPLILR